MKRKLTITVSESVYEGLHRTIGPGRNRVGSAIVSFGLLCARELTTRAGCLARSVLQFRHYLFERLVTSVL